MSGNTTSPPLMGAAPFPLAATLAVGRWAALVALCLEAGLQSRGPQVDTVGAGRGGLCSPGLPPRVGVQPDKGAQDAFLLISQSAS